MADREYRTSRREFLKAMTGGLFLAGIPKISRAQVPEGIIHFDFGRHETLDDGKRLAPHFETSHPPDHYFMEGTPWDDDLARKVSEDEYVVRMREQNERHVIATKQFAAGTHLPHPSMQTTNPFGYVQAFALVVGAKRGGKQIAVHFEPFDEEIIRAHHRYISRRDEAFRNAMTGDLEGAFKNYSEAREEFAKMTLNREKAIVKYLKNLQEQDPNSRILAPFGVIHEHLADILKRKGAKVEKQTSRGMTPYPTSKELKAYLLAEHGLKPKPTKTDIENLKRRSFLEFVLHSPGGITKEKVAEIIDSLSPREVNSILDDFQGSGQGLNYRFKNWLKQHRKL